MSKSSRSMDDPHAELLLVRCSQRATDALRALGDAHPQEIKAMYTRMSSSDRELLQGMYLRETLISFGVGAATLGLALPSRNKPFMSALIAASIGAAASMFDISRQMPKVVQQMLSSPSRSVADEMVCPAVSEFIPCANDPTCAALMNSKLPALDQCYRLCQQRKHSLKLSFQLHGEEHSTTSHGTNPTQDAEDSTLLPTEHGVDTMENARASHETGTSWDAVRARHRESIAGGNQSRGETMDKPLVDRGQGNVGVQQGRKNVYGDDCME